MTVSQNKIAIMAAFIALSSALYAIETFIPKPFPFIRVGLANIIVLFVIIQFGFMEGLILGVSKSIIGSIITGSLLSPSFILSISGSFVAVLLMYAIWKTHLFGIIGLSVLGSVGNIITQLLIVSLLFTGIPSAKYLFPLLVIVGTINGIITGFFTFYLLKFYKRRFCVTNED